MDFLSFQKAIANAQCPKWTPRQKYLDALERALYGELYTHLGNAFSTERKDAYSPRLLLDERRASAPYRLPRIIVHEATGMLFGEEHRPTIVCRNDDYTSTWVQAFIEDSAFWLTLIEAAYVGSVGSVALVLRVLGESDESEDGEGNLERTPRGAGAYYWEVWPGKECSPIFKRSRPGELQSLERTYFVKSDALRADGYDVDAMLKQWADAESSTPSSLQQRSSDEWVLRCRLSDVVETWYEPIPRSIYEEPDFDASRFVIDPNRTFAHDLGEVPARWIVPIRDRHHKFPDGMCYFEPAIDYQFRIDRTVSQTGRAIDYAGDPQLALAKGKTGEGAFGEDDQEIGGTAEDVVEVTEKGGAWFLEIKGDGLNVAIDTYVKMLIRLAKEVVGASRIEHDSKVGLNLSGTAMKLLNSSLIYLVGILRITFGELGLVPLLRLAMRMAQRVDVELPSLAARLEEAQSRSRESAFTGGSEPNPNALVELQWPPYYEPTGQDKLFEVQAVTTAVEGGVISQETGVANAATMFDVQDSSQELDRITTETSERQAQELNTATTLAQVSATAKAGAAGKTGA